MAKYVIQGGFPLAGEIAVAGAKNAALKILAAALLSQEDCQIQNVPQIEDIKRLVEILEKMGVEVSWQESSLTVKSQNLKKANPDPDLVKKLRSSIMLVGPLLARFGEVTMSHPGGCVIGQRPIDLFLDNFKQMGAEVYDHDDFFTLKCKKLRGIKIVLPWISVTATEALMMTACLAEGTTTLVNAAMEPEIPSLADYLNNCGAKITGAGSPTIRIQGVNRLTGGTYNLIPDRIEAGSLVMAGLITGSQIKVSQCQPQHLETVLHTLQRAGANLEIGPDYILTKKSRFRATELRTHEYPGFPTDLQAPYTVLMTQAHGQTLIHEMIYEGRLFYTDKLVAMGAKIIMCDPHRVIVSGPTPLIGRKLESPDLRAGMALVLAGLVAEGTTEIENIYQIERGYQNIVERLQSIGAKIQKQD